MTLPSRRLCYREATATSIKFADVNQAMATERPGLIFDIRGYPLGTGFVIARRLAADNKRIIGVLFRRPYWRGDWIAGGDELASEEPAPGDREWTAIHGQSGRNTGGAAAVRPPALAAHDAGHPRDSGGPAPSDAEVASL